MATSIAKSHTNEFIALMAVMMSVVAISIDAMLPALAQAGADLGATHPNHAQYIISAIFAGMCIGQLVSGPLSDTLGRRRVVFGGLGVYLAGSLLCLFSNSMETMLLGRFIQGLGVSGPFVSVMSIVRDKFSGDKMAKIMSLVMMIFIMVPTIAPALGQGILMLAPWRAIFVLYLFYAVAVGLWVYFRLEETLPPSRRRPFNPRSLLGATKAVCSNRTTISYTIAVGCVFGAMIAYLSSIQQVFQMQFGIGSMFALFFGLQAMSFGLSSLINSQLVEKFGMRRICLTSVGAFSLIAWVFLLLNQFIQLPFAMYFIFGASSMFCIAMVFGNANAVALEPMGHIAGSASAMVGFISNIIGIPLGTLIGQSYNGTLTPIFAGFGILGLVAFLLMFSESSHHTRKTKAA